MADKKVLNTSTQKSTKTAVQPDGTVIETITTVTTEKLSDGSTQTRTGVETITKPPGSSGGASGVSSRAGLVDDQDTTSEFSTSSKAKVLGASNSKATTAASTSGLAAPPPPSNAGLSVEASSRALVSATNAKLGATPKIGVGSSPSASTTASTAASTTSGAASKPNRLGARAGVGAGRFIKVPKGVGGKAPASVSPKDSNAPKVANTTPPAFIQEALNQHNVLRAKHHSPPLVLNADLAKISQAWANNLAKIGKMQHSTCGYGENVYWCTENVDGKRPTDQWYSEIKDFNWKKMEGQSGTGHFTQVIWKGSQEFGIAMAKGPNGVYVVANYNPPGNFVGRYAENVLPA